MAAWLDRLIGPPRSRTLYVPTPADRRPRGGWPITWTATSVVGSGGGAGLTLLFLPAPPNGITWLGSVNVTGGTTNDLTALFIGQGGTIGPAAASWLGGSTYGPFALRDMQAATLLVLSFQLGGTLTATFSGVGFHAEDEPMSFPLPLATVGSTAETQSFPLGVSTFVVPPGVTQLVVDISGASGGPTNNPPFTIPSLGGGRGGRMQAIIPVTPGQSLVIDVGAVGGPGLAGGSAGAGGAPGGATGGTGSSFPGGGGGGGYTGVFNGTETQANALVVAGGGGGSGTASHGGVGGGLVAGAGDNGAAGNTGGGGGTQVAGGAAGTGTNANGGPGTALAGGVGGASAGPESVGGAGGAGGYYGGGGGGGPNTGLTAPGEGGGGSSFSVSTATLVIDTPGVNQGNGLASVSWVH